MCAVQQISPRNAEEDIDAFRKGMMGGVIILKNNYLDQRPQDPTPTPAFMIFFKKKDQANSHLR